MFEFVAEPRERGASLGMAMAVERQTPERGETLEVAELERQVAELEASAPESPLLVTLYSQLGEAYEGRYEYGRALGLYEQALKLAEAKKDRAGQARALLNLGDSLRFSRRPFQAVEFYERALALYRELEDRQGEAASLGNLGLAYDSLGEYQRAIDFLQQTLDIAKAIGDRNGEANALGNLGNAYFLLGEYQRAIDFHQQSLDIAKAIGDRNGEAANLYNLARALARTDDKWEARSCYKAARALHAAMGLQHRVEQCDAALRDLGQQIVVVPKRAPELAAPLQRRRRRVPLWVWFAAGLGVALVLWWLLQS